METSRKTHPEILTLTSVSDIQTTTSEANFLLRGLGFPNYLKRKTREIKGLSAANRSLSAMNFWRDQERVIAENLKVEMTVHGDALNVNRPGMLALTQLWWSKAYLAPMTRAWGWLQFQWLRPVLHPSRGLVRRVLRGQRSDVLCARTTSLEVYLP